MALERIFARIMPQPLHSGRLPVHLIPLLIVAYSCLLPREFTLDIQGAALLPYRLALILMAPLAIARLAQSPVRPMLIDAFAGFASVWFIVSLVVMTSFNDGMITGTSYAIDYGFAYLLGRASIRTAEDLRLVFRYFLPGALALVPLLALESFSHRLMRPILAGLLNQPQPDVFYDFRFGILRASGPFPHPILGGVFLAGFLPMAWYLAHNTRERLLGCAAAMGALFTVSSTAAIGIMLALAAIVLEIMQRLTRWPIFAVAAVYTVLMLVVISVWSESGLLNFLIRNLTFDAGTGYYRLAIWEYGGAEALANPIFGIGFRDWARPEYMYTGSVDAYWLVQAMSHGLPSPIALGLVMVGAIFGVLRTQRFRHKADADAARAIVVFIVIAIVCGFTVHFWEAVNSWIALVIGGGASLASQARVAPIPQWYVPPPVQQSLPIRPVAAE